MQVLTVIHYPYTDKHFYCHTFGARKYGTEMEITYNIFTQQFVSTQINKIVPSRHLNPKLHQEALWTSSAKCAKCQVVF